MREKTACFTGHREIPKRDMRKVRRNTLNAIIKAYENEYRYFGSGGAIGFDLLTADCVLHLKRNIRIFGLYSSFPATDKPNTGRIKKYGNTIK